VGISGGATAALAVAGWILTVLGLSSTSIFCGVCIETVRVTRFEATSASNCTIGVVVALAWSPYNAIEVDISFGHLSVIEDGGEESPAAVLCENSLRYCLNKFCPLRAYQL
jgi:hypothetical protein